MYGDCYAIAWVNDLQGGMDVGRPRFRMNLGTCWPFELVHVPPKRSGMSMNRPFAGLEGIETPSKRISCAEMSGQQMGMQPGGQGRL